MERHALIVTGLVQGVGFRPYVYTLARDHGLTGWVRNDAVHVRIEVEGPVSSLFSFVQRLTNHPPPLARVESVVRQIRPLEGASSFRILSSDLGVESEARIPADTAICDACLAELRSPTDRRFSHAFIACCDCGPRLSMATATPYDRERTTMGDFELCGTCRREYEDPANRRYHAQPIACPGCGPTWTVRRDARPVSCEMPLREVARALRSGAVVALKGIGGFHYCCIATNQQAVISLRREKKRPAKPFALMMRDLGEVRRFASISPEEEALLTSEARPVVLLPRASHCALADAIAPGSHMLGIMLPYAPLHHLLFDELGPVPLVMTSGNESGEAIATSAEQLEIDRNSDTFVLDHDRRIVVPVEDSVARIVRGHTMLIRRSRGYAPTPLTMPVALKRPTLATGGTFKAVFALGQNSTAILSPHLGELEHPESLQAWVSAIEHFERLFRIRPQEIVADWHPDYESQRYALKRARGEGVLLRLVQHHHAHMAACMAEHGLRESVIGVCFDGIGLGESGEAWGGEILAGDFRSVRRVAHLQNVSLPGGDQAAREPWRMALAYLSRAGLGTRHLKTTHEDAVRVLRTCIDRNAFPETSSAGRLFDAVSALVLGIESCSFEAQGASALEEAAAGSTDGGAYSFPLVEATTTSEEMVISTDQLFQELHRDLDRGVDAATMSLRFHRGLAIGIAATCSALRERGGPERVVLSGGVFCNALLTMLTVTELERRGFVAYFHERVPPNDGGLALGQLAIAAAGGGVMEGMSAACA